MKDHLKYLIKDTSSNTIGIKGIVIGMISLLVIGYVVKKNKKAVLPLALLSSSCAQGTIPHAFKPVGFSEDEIQQLQDATDEWNQKSNGKYSALIMDSCDDSCSKVESVPYIEDKADALASCIGYKSYNGLTLPSTCSKVQDADKYDLKFSRAQKYDIRKVALHELGHVFGKQDSNISGNIMYFNYPDEPDHLTDDDVK